MATIMGFFCVLFGLSKGVCTRGVGFCLVADEHYMPFQYVSSLLLEVSKHAVQRCGGCNLALWDRSHLSVGIKETI